MISRFGITLLFMALVGGQIVHADPMDIYCTIRSSGGNLNCQLLGKERKVMNAEDITNFVDAAEVAAYITLKSRKGMERMFMIDSHANQYKRLVDAKKSSSISEIAKVKAELFAEIEKKVIKLSDELDGQAAAAELVLYDSSLTYDKMKRDNRTLTTELEGYRKNKDKVCTTTPACELMRSSTVASVTRP